MQGYKSTAERLARTFKRSRDSWKARAAQKQQKLRALEIKVRDLSASRDYWKRKAQALSQDLRELETEVSAQAKKGGASASPQGPISSLEIG